MSPDDAPDPAEEQKLINSALERVADQQLERAERVRAAARQMFAYTAAFFTVAQTVAFTNFGKDRLTTTEETILYLAALVAALVLGITGVATVLRDRLRTVPDVSAEDVLKVDSEAIQQGQPVGARLGALWAKVGMSRADAADERAGKRDSVAIWAGATIALVILEIALALIFRLP